ncbi:hypothetical protein HGA34_02800 [Candidatus Falkowbacteria bacterium]|nr:hypothetical protein [Candidatus Falkowbacteria bacterium]
MVIIAKKYFFRLVMLALSIYIGYHWYVSYPKDQPREAGKIFSFVTRDVGFHWDEFKQAVRDFQHMLVKDINTEARVRRGGMDRLARALDYYKGEKENYPEKIDDVASWYKDYNEITKDPSFKYEPSADGKHFRISLTLNNGEVYSVER